MLATPLALAASLLAAATSGAPAADPEGGVTTLRLYPVASLLAETRDEPAPQLGLFPLLGGSTAPAGGEGLPNEAILEILLRALGEERFEAAGRSMAFTPGGLLVRQTPENHERIRRILSLLAAAEEREAAVDVRVLEIETGAREKLRGAVLGAAERAALLRDPGARTVASYSASGAFGSRLSLGSARETRFLSDFDVEIAQSATIADPQVDEILDGFRASVRLVPCGSGALDIEATAEIAVLDEPMRSLALDAPALGRIDLPALECARISGTAALPAGSSLALVAHGAEGRASIVVLITPRAASPGAPEAIDAADAPVEARVADVGTATYSPRTFVALAARGLGDAERHDVYSGRLADRSGIEGGGAAQDAETALVSEALSLAAGDGAFVRPISGGHAFVLGNPAAQSAVSDAVDSLLAPRRLTVEVTLAAVPLTAEEAASADLGADAETLLAAARANREGSVLFQSAVVSGDQAAMSLGREMSFLGDYNVEVAQGSKVADPQVAFAFAGAAAEVRVTRSENSARVVAEVRFVRTSDAGHFEARSNGSNDVGVIEFPSARRSAVSRRFVTEIGKTAVALVGTAKGLPVALVVAVAEP